MGQKVLEPIAGAACMAWRSRPRPVKDGSASAQALQQRRCHRPASVLGLALWTVALQAQAENWRITPNVALTETLTNNVFLSSTNKTSDLVTGITPGISIEGKGARASLRLSYTFTEQLYAHETSQNNHQNSLNAIGSLEAIENWLFIDATGTISQQYLSAFGAVSPSTANVNRNQTETSSYSISPYIKGRILSSTEYLVRYRATTTSSQSNLVSDQTTSDWLGRLNGTTRFTALTWALDASDTTNNYQLKDYQDRKYNASLSYRFSSALQASVFGGQESQNYVSIQDQTHTTHGFGFEWTPDPRTQLSATNNKRFYGNGYSINFRHQMPRSLITYTATRDISNQPASVGNTGQGTNYDAYYSIIAASNPGASPDAIRAQVIEVLQGRGVSPDGTVVNGYLSNRPILQESQQLSIALLGIRNTVTLNANETKQQPLGLVNGLTDDFSLSNQITQRGFGVIWGHKLTGFSSLSLSLNQTRSLSQRSGQVDTKTEGAYLLLTTQVSPKTRANIGARRVIADGISGYNESALTGSLSHSF